IHQAIEIDITGIDEEHENGTLTVSIISEGDKARIWERNGSFPTYTWILHNKQFVISKEDWDKPDWGDATKIAPGLYIEGVEFSEGDRDVDLRLEYQNDQFRAEDIVKVTILGVDLDVDSDNDDVLDAPKRDL